jgi:hypothetical protein
MSTAGVFTWTPTEGQGPGNYNLFVIATDNGVPSLSTTQAVNITVNESNTAPFLASINSQNVNEGALVSCNALAADIDRPAQALSFSLGAGAPSGAAITTNGSFTWTPTEAQGPGNYNIFVIVSDNGSPSLSETQIVNIVVNELNSAPVLAAMTSHSIIPGQAFSFTATAMDSDIPVQTLTYAIISGTPNGATFNPTNGHFTWTPETDTPAGTNQIVFRVSDDGIPSLSATQMLTVVIGSAPRITSLTRETDGQIRLEWNAASGQRYQVVWAESPEGPWHELGSFVTAIGDIAFALDPTSEEKARFYRVRAEP